MGTLQEGETTHWLASQPSLSMLCGSSMPLSQVCPEDGDQDGEGQVRWCRMRNTEETLRTKEKRRGYGSFWATVRGGQGCRGSRKQKRAHGFKDTPVFLQN